MCDPTNPTDVAALADAQPVQTLARPVRVVAVFPHRKRTEQIEVGRVFSSASEASRVIGLASNVVAVRLYEARQRAARAGGNVSVPIVAQVRGVQLRYCGPN